ncbi:UDP-forming cellulose synthase catalytic subunit [Salipiger mucosus]|uniref:Cellulose synthase catalytic subunit [UDP-forming] n=1 Tax=Salipiger mucosus DSM 16094 TaxID=1123237 RepID=S9QL88_9RHOB|nr:UDP-forming cellulose synthase catalytic subunit [Salipiger mucosus]EPX80368.1 Cellulose synthase catalytic subunit (UDP-forming) [Salipiger mucosus DSM 16094]
MSGRINIARGTLWLLLPVWVALLVPILFLASVPTSVTVQGLLAIVTCIAIFALKPFVHGSLPVRFAVLAIASVFVLRYWIWRLLETLPSLDDPLSLAAALVLFAAETFTVGLFFLSALVTADPVSHPPPPRLKLTEVPSVDILVPSYNESDELLAVTLAAAKRVTYPEDKKTVVLCDDGGTDQRCNHADPAIAAAARERRARLQALCEKMGVVYTTRARNESAKAGNLNAALKELDGEIVLVLDADHVPTRDILTRTVGYFAENPRLFLVQTPHFFTNRDPIERNLALPEVCPSENEMFYTEIHRGLDRLGGAFFCGSAALLRRRALDEVGGIAGETITEDAETALEIHSRGWESMYVEHAMVAGLQPETFASFIQQRGRWATGMIQMLILKNPLFRKGLSLPQRVCYINSMSFWLFPLVRTVFLLSPMVYLFFGLEIFVVTAEEVLAYILPYLLIGFMIQNALYANVRWPQVSEVYEIAQTPYVLRAVIGTILRPRAATFKVTAKDDGLDHAFLSPIARPLVLLAGLLLAGLVAGVVRWIYFPGDRAVVQIVGAWNAYNFLLAAFALRAVFERPWRLVKPRTAVSTPARLTLEPDPDAGDTDEATTLDVTIIAASAAAVQLQLDVAPGGAEGREWQDGGWEGRAVTLAPVLPKAPELEEPLPATIGDVRGGVDGIRIGLEVAPDHIVPASRLAAHIVYGDSSRWHFFRKVRPQGTTLLTGFVYVLGKSLVSVPKSLFDFAREPARRRRHLAADLTVPEDAFAKALYEQPAPVASGPAHARRRDPEYLEIED